MERKLNLFPANERRKEGREKSINYLYQRTWKILYFPRHESTQLNCHPRAIDLPRVLFVPETRKDDTFTDIRTRSICIRFGPFVDFECRLPPPLCDVSPDRGCPCPTFHRRGEPTGEYLHLEGADTGCRASKGWHDSSSIFSNDEKDLRSILRSRSFSSSYYSSPTIKFLYWKIRREWYIYIELTIRIFCRKFSRLRFRKY